MQTPHRIQSAASRDRRGTALLMALLLLFVLIAIVIQLRIGTSTVAQVADNEVAITSMDLAIESALLQVYEELKADGEAAAGAAAQVPTEGGGEATPEAAAEGGATGEPAQASDSREDEWARVKRPTINDIELRVLVQDEDSKINVLGMQSVEEEEADKVFERVMRVIDLCRESTAEDIDLQTARQMAQALRDFLVDRRSIELPMAELVSNQDGNADRAIPFSLREFAAVEPFHEGHFRDFRDEEGIVVHSLGSFLTVWSSIGRIEDVGNTEEAPPPGSSSEEESQQDSESEDDEPGEEEETEGEQGQEGEDAGSTGDPADAQSAAKPGGKPGAAVNVNTAPSAVLMALMEERDVPPRFWDEVVEYRNLEEEEEEDDEESEEEPVYDEFGEEVIRRQIFDSLKELEDVPGYTDLEVELRRELEQRLTTESQVFTIFITARRRTGGQESFSGYLGGAEERREEEEKGDTLVRTVRSVVWRRAGEEGVSIVPLIRWDVLDYTPFEVLDYPDEER